MCLPHSSEFKNSPANIALTKAIVFTEPKEDPTACISPNFTPCPGLAVSLRTHAAPTDQTER